MGEARRVVTDLVVTRSQVLAEVRAAARTIQGGAADALADAHDIFLVCSLLLFLKIIK